MQLEGSRDRNNECARVDGDDSVVRYWLKKAIIDFNYITDIKSVRD